MRSILKFILLALLLISTADAEIYENETAIAYALRIANIQVREGDKIDFKFDPRNNTQLFVSHAHLIDDSAEHSTEHVDQDATGRYSLNIYTFDMNRKKLIDQYKVKESLISDAISLDSIQLDTAAYKINDSNRALALRLNYSGHSQPNPFSMQVMNLYDLQNKKNLLEGLIVERYRAETDTRCNADIEKRKSVLMMQKTQSKHYYDIQVRIQMDHYQYTGDTDNCKASKHTLSQHSFVLKFDGTRYQLPQQAKDDYEYLIQ